MFYCKGRQELYAAFLCSAIVGVLSAQQTVNNASVGGRVTDPSGAAIQNARVAARQMDTNIVSVVETNREGRFRFPYLKVGRYEIMAGHVGFADVTEPVTLTVGSAFDLPIALHDCDEFYKRYRGRPSRTSRRRQIPNCRHGSRSRDQRPSLQWTKPVGYRTAGTRCFSHQHGKQSAFRRDIGGSGTRHLGEQPAQLLQQLRCGRAFRQR